MTHDAEFVTLDQIADRLVSEAGIAARPGQMASLLVLSERVRAYADVVERVRAVLDDHGDCFAGAPIHETYDNECVDDCAGCCADDVIRRLGLLLPSPDKGASQ